jgi:hypothetical protein
MTRPTLSEAITVSEWWKNRRGGSIRMTLSTYADRNLVDLRTWFTAGGKLRPSKGFTAAVRHLPRLAAALAKAESKARDLGLIAGDNDNEEAGGAE